MSDSSRNQYQPIIFIVLVLVYVITGKLGLMLALPPGYASAIFPPSGIALAAAYLAGRKVLPWVFLGSLLLNIWVGYSAYRHISETALVTALSIAFASMLQAAIGGWGLTRAIGPQSRFDQVSDLLRFLLIVPLVCLISATLSVSGLVTMNVIDMNGFINGWLAWWTGDTLGALVLFPICLVFAARPYSVWRNRRRWVALPMLLALVLAIISFVIGSKWEENNSLMEFRSLSDQIKGQIVTRIDQQYMLLVNTRAFFSHNDKPLNRDEFGRYMQKTLEHFDSIQAIEWAPRIEDSQRSAFEAAQKKELPDFQIRERDAGGQLIPAQHRPSYYPVTYLEPMTGNQPALGLDLTYDPKREAALAKAVSENKFVSTEPVQLVQDKTDQTGILLIYPAIENDSASGVVLTVLKMGHFIEKLLPENSSIMFVRLVDVEADKNLYNSFTSDSIEPLTAETISFGERQYRLETAPTPTYWIQHQGLQSYGILAVGLFGIGVLGSLLLLGTGYTTRVEMQVRDRTRELLESEKRFRAMADSVPVLIWLAAPDKLCSWFNKVWLEFTGRTMEQELGNGWAEGVHPDDLQHCLDMYISHFDRRQPFTIEYRLKRHDGEYRWLSDNGIPRYDNEGRFEGYIGSCIDITEMRLAQDRLQAGHDLLDKLSQHVPGVIYQFRRFPDGRACFPYASEGIQEIYEVTPAEVSEDAAPAFARLHPDDLDRIAASIQDSVSSLKLWNLEYRVNLPQKGVRWLFGQARPEKMEDGSILWHGFITDITERKQAERIIQDTNRRYQELLAAASEVSIIATDKDGLIRLFNRGAERMLGYSAEEVVGRISPTPFHLAEEIDRRGQELSNELGYPVAGFEVFITKPNIDGQEQREWTYVRKDGTHLFVSLVATAVRSPDGVINGYLGIAQDITGRKRMEEKLRDSEAFNIGILNSLTAHIAVLDEQGVIVTVNNAWRRFAKENGGQAMLGVNYLDMCKSAFNQPDGNEADAAQSGITAVLGGELETFHLEYSCHSPNQQRWFYMNVSPLQGSRHGVVVSHENITERKQAEARMQLAASVFTHAREGILITDANATIIEVNDTFTRITGYSREEALGQNPRMLQSGRQSREFYAAMWQSISDQGYWYGEIWNRRKDGEAYVELLTISAVRDAEGKTQNYVALFTDITPMKEYQRQLEHIAHYDVLTGLPNRVLLAERLQRAMIQSQRHNQSLAVVFLDLDGFKAVNDSHGHAVGDQLLVTVGNRMKMALREGDTLARIGGDEFVAVLVELDPPLEYELMLARLLQAAAAPVPVGEAILQVSASIGVTVYPQDGADADQLMRHADQAMYQAKQAGKNRYHLFDRF